MYDLTTLQLVNMGAAVGRPVEIVTRPFAIQLAATSTVKTAHRLGINPIKALELVSGQMESAARADGWGDESA